jgi:hypothetical protein
MIQQIYDKLVVLRFESSARTNPRVGSRAGIRTGASQETTSMKRTLTVAATLATIAITLAGTTTHADAWWRHGGWGWGPGIAAGLLGGAIIGGAIASSRYYYPPPPGWAYYPAYAQPVPAEGCYWARMPITDPAGNVVAWRGRPRLVCPPY